MRTKSPTRWPLLIEYFDRMPREAREALASTAILGNGSPLLRIERAPGSVMAERIKRADAMMMSGDNTVRYVKCSAAAINAILSGAA